MPQGYLLLSSILLLSLAAVPGATAGNESSEEENAPISYNQHIRPILSAKCFVCHGPDSSSRKAGLRLDNAQDAYRDRDGFSAISPGKSDSSLLIERIFADDPDDIMPPPETHKSLDGEERSILRRWIEQGAKYEPHWSWTRPERPVPPSVEGVEATTPIDVFIRNRLHQEQLPWKPRASRETLIRRATFDLTGLPPTVEEIDIFLADTEAGAWERLLDRLLSSNRFGEHWGRQWLDAARYADTHGLHLDNYREMWPYRDRVIELFNDNPPFDEFVIRQLAGDLLPEANLDDQIDSGFVRSHPTTSEGGAINEEYRMIYSVDRTNTFGTVFLGLTVGCAQCHDHKFDPVTQKEYFGLYAFFNNTSEAEMDGNAKAHPPVVKVPTMEQSSRLDVIGQELTRSLEKRDAPDEQMDAAQLSFETRWTEGSNRWQQPIPESMTSSAGSTVEALPDGSHRFTGTNAAKDIYTFTTLVEAAQFRAIRLEGLLDPSMPANGPGRSANSNVVLTEIEAQVVAVDGELNPVGDPTAISFTDAWADHEQPKFPVADAIDGDISTGDKGWAVSGFDRKEARTAIFSSEEPFGTEGMVRLTVNLRFESQFTQHAFGRVRLSLAADPYPLAEEQPWIDDHQGNGGTTLVDGVTRDWNWVEGSDHPIHSGSRSRLQQTDGDRITQHYFHNATDTVTVRGGDLLYGWVWIDEKQPTRTVMLQFNSNGSWDHRAFWGEDLISFGDIGSDVIAHRPMGDLPPSGGWVRLEVSADHVGLPPGSVINGMAFTQFGGKAYWDDAGILGFRDLLEMEAVLAIDPSSRSEEDSTRLRRWFRQRHSPAFAQLLDEIDKYQQEKNSIQQTLPTTLVAAERMDRRETRLLNRGQYDDPVGDPIEPGIPSFLPPLPEDAPKNRMGLARWLTDPDHPLLARVTVNRIWQSLFGVGLVQTSEDFGSQGALPSHPELLDWLAREFVDEGWDLKKLIRSLMQTDSYCQQALITELDLQKDPENRLLSRGPRFRLDAEMIRDQALLLSGLLVEKFGGPSVKPYQPAGLWKAVGYSDSNTVKFSKDSGEALYRRSLYTFWKRTSPPPYLAILDAPNRETCVVRRERTNTPMQALLLLNDIQYVECSRQMASRIHREQAQLNDEQKLQHLWRMATGRQPQQVEKDDLLEFLNEMLEYYRANPEAAARLLEVGDSPAGDALAVEVHAAWTMVCSLILNLDEVVTKG